MPHRNGKRRRNSSNGKRSRQSPMVKDVRESLLNTQTSSLPLTRDVVLSRPNAERIYNFEFSQTNLITSSTVAEVDGSILLQLNNLNGYTAITTLFDAYRIVGARSQFFPTSNTYSSVGTAPIFTVLDFDDSTSTLISALLQYDTLKVAPPTVFFERSYKPRTAVAAYGGAFTQFAQGSKNLWIDSASPGVFYFGIKYGVPLNSAGVSWTVATTVWVQAKSQR